MPNTSHVGLFNHGQLHVALSRVGNMSSIKVLIKTSSGEMAKSTHNVVYKEVFHIIKRQV